MTESYIPLLAGFIGAIIGAGASITTILIQAHFQNKRDRMRLVSEVALEDFKLKREMGLKHTGEYEEWPLAVFLHYHAELMSLIEKNALTPESHEALTKKSQVFMDAIKRTSKTGTVVYAPKSSSS